RLHIAHTVHEARNIIIDVVSASGASAHFLDNPLQRIQRDINTLVGHTVFDLDIASETYGAMLLSDT
ncbi:MAG: acyl-CoA dehydrogenase, partial [bacterium]